MLTSSLPSKTSDLLDRIRKILEISLDLLVGGSGPAPSGDAYADGQAKMHNFLCSYDMPDMLQLRRYMLYRIHDRLLSMDFGPMHNALDSDCEGIIAEAERFVSARVGGRR